MFAEPLDFVDHLRHRFWVLDLSLMTWANFWDGFRLLFSVSSFSCFFHGIPGCFFCGEYMAEHVFCFTEKFGLDESQLILW